MAHILLDTAVYPLYWVRSKNTLKQGQFLEISNVAATCKLMVKENLERSWKKSWKVMESHGIWRAQKNTNPVNYMCSVVLIITGKDLPIPNSRVQNVSCWNGNSEEPAPPHLLISGSGWPGPLLLWGSGSAAAIPRIIPAGCLSTRKLGTISHHFLHISHYLSQLWVQNVTFFYLLGVGKSVIECRHILYFNISQLSKEELGMLSLFM